MEVQNDTKQMLPDWARAYTLSTNKEILREALDIRQQVSKLWLVTELDRFANGGTVAIYGGWCGLMANLLHYYSKHEWSRLISIDIDPRCTVESSRLCGNIHGFTAITGDMCTYSPEFKIDVAINTIVEHIDQKSYMEWFRTLPKGIIIALQSNNHVAPFHPHPSKSVEELVDRSGFDTILFQGTTIMSKTFSRFMVIGVKG